MTSVEPADLDYLTATRNSLEMYERWLYDELKPRDCEWCGGVRSQVWMPYTAKDRHGKRKNRPIVFENLVSWGSWRCQWYGQCEAAPG